MKACPLTTLSPRKKLLAPLFGGAGRITKHTATKKAEETKDIRKRTQVDEYKTKQSNQRIEYRTSDSR